MFKGLKGFKKVLSLVVVLILLVGTSGYAQSESETYKIGAILPMTGELSFFGEGDREALQLFEKKHPNVKILYEDSKGTAKDGLSAANKLVAQGVRYYITSLSYIVNTIQPVLDKNQCLNFTLNMDPRSEERSAYTFRLYVSFYDEMNKLIQLVDKNKYKRVAVLYVNVETMNNAVENYLARKLKDRGVELITETYKIGTRDFRPLLIKIADRNPDVLRILDFGDKLGVILKMIAELRILPEMPIVSGIETLLADYAKFPAEVTHRFRFTAPKVFLDPTNPVVAEYKKVYGHSPNYDAMFTYDIANILVPVIEKHGYDNVGKVIEEIVSMKRFKGVAAEYTINEHGGVSPEIYWAKIEKGKIVF